MGCVMIFPQDYVLQEEDIVFVMSSSLQHLAKVAKLDPKKVNQSRPGFVYACGWLTLHFISALPCSILCMACYLAAAALLTAPM